MADKSGGDGGSADSGGGDVRSILDQRNNLTRFMMHKKLTTIRADLAAKKAASNKGRVRGSGPGQPPKKVGLSKSRLMGRMGRREAADNDDEIMRDL